MELKQYIIIGLAAIVLIAIGIGLTGSLQPQHEHITGNERMQAAQEKLNEKLEQQYIAEGKTPTEAYELAWVCPVCHKVVYEGV